MENQYTTVTTAEMWATVQAMGTYEQNYRNGELWSFNEKLYYLSHLSLSPDELRKVVDFCNGSETI